MVVSLPFTGLQVELIAYNMLDLFLDLVGEETKMERVSCPYFLIVCQLTNPGFLCHTLIVVVIIFRHPSEGILTGEKAFSIVEENGHRFFRTSAVSCKSSRMNV